MHIDVCILMYNVLQATDILPIVQREKNYIIKARLDRILTLLAWTRTLADAEQLYG
jgi:hypothetical protein